MALSVNFVQVQTGVLTFVIFACGFFEIVGIDEIVGIESK
jgi:hypothetical protein